MEGEGSGGPVAARLPQQEWASLSTDGLSDIRLRLVELARRLLLGAESRDMLEKVRELSEPFFRNVIRFHNRLAESAVTEKLSMRLFYIVTQVKRGRGYREIGHSMGIAHGRARNLVFEAYKRLGVHKYTEIGKFVW